MDYDNISNKYELLQYIEQVCKDHFCKKWKEASSLNNKNRKWKERVLWDGQIMNYYYDGVKQLVESNDLNDELVFDGREHLIKTMESCGWSQNRQDWK